MEKRSSLRKHQQMLISMGSGSLAVPTTLLSEKQHAELQPSSQPARVCKLHEYKAIAHTLALSFADDPVALHFIDLPDTKHWSATRKWNLHVAIMEALVYAHLLCGLVTTAGPDYEAVALWLPPNSAAAFDSFATQFRSGMWSLRWKFSAMGRARFCDEFMPLLHDVKHRVLGASDNAEYYLVYLGTKPGARRMGYARALLEDGIARAEDCGAPCYLECSKAINVGIYQKFGFEVRERIELETEDAGRAVPLDIMVREPSEEIFNEKI
jgi:ribosomal protein S18 acetylase RimI-like enzyme